MAADAPDRPLVISPKGTFTYGEVLTRSEALARGLQERGVERFGIAADDAADVIMLLVASAMVGAEACTYPRFADEGQINAHAERFGHAVVVTTRDVSLQQAEVVAIDGLAIEQGEAPAEPESNPVMILTTGTTGDPKGARHDWARLADAMRPRDEPGKTRWLLAYNLNQFGGVQVMLQALVSGTTIVAAPSGQAHEVIETLRANHVTHLSATPTFWRILAGTLDEATAAELALRQVTLGGEAAPGPLLERLRELFPDARISHVYAGTEVGSIVSVRDGKPGLPRSVLERGDDAEIELRVVDGELQIRSNVGMLGYHESSETAGEWVATGDLVEERDGRLHFVGRTNEIINVGGAKVHPLPIEEIVSGVDGVALVTAYGHPNPVTGQIVAIDVVPQEGIDTEALEDAIRDACEAALPRPGRPRRIKFVDALEVRDSKVVRRGA